MNSTSLIISSRAERSFRPATFPPPSPAANPFPTDFCCALARDATPPLRCFARNFSIEIFPSGFHLSRIFSLILPLPMRRNTSRIFPDFFFYEIFVVFLSFQILSLSPPPPPNLPLTNIAKAFTKCFRHQ